MKGSVKSKEDLFVLKGKVKKGFSYYITVEDFMNSPKYKMQKNVAFIAALFSMFVGVLLPLIVGFFTSFDSWNSEFYQICLMSNSIIAIPFCLPLSLVFIFGAIPLYKKLVDRAFVKNGFVKKQSVIKSVA